MSKAVKSKVNILKVDSLAELEDEVMPNFERMQAVMTILDKYGEKNLQADRGIIYLNTICPSKVSEADKDELFELDCEYSSHYGKWFINT